MTTASTPSTLSTRDDLRGWLASRDPRFWPHLAGQLREARAFDELMFLATLRRRALQQGFAPAPDQAATPIRFALAGGYSLSPLKDLIEPLLFAHGYAATLWTGDYDNYVSEILDGTSALYAFAPDVVALLPSGRRAVSKASLFDSAETHRAEVANITEQITSLCGAIHAHCGASVIVTNFRLPAHHDLGPYRMRSLGSEWSFKKAVNTAIGETAPPFVQVCDLEFIAYRLGGLAATDERAWFESKQIGSPALLVALADELVRCIGLLKRPARKVLVLDLDNTLWGGVIGDDGIDGIEIGDTSPRGEAFKAFQTYLLSLQQRGVLLAVCSKNDLPVAEEPFASHPEMVLRLPHFAAFKASWQPKSDAIREIAAELQLGLDSFVFVDDNPAEIEIVRQFLPEVATIHVGPDPADFVPMVSNSRLFEPRTLTSEDAARTVQYAQERDRQLLMGSVADMSSYLASLQMIGRISPFTTTDVPRIAQLINKSNQFNLTTKRRTEGDVAALIDAPGFAGITMRLSDRFGDHGLIGIVILEVAGPDMIIDTLLMSCRVLKRGVEDELINEIVRIAGMRGCRRVVGRYIPTAKNGMVKDFYPSMGFVPGDDDTYRLDVASRAITPTHIRIERTA